MKNYIKIVAAMPAMFMVFLIASNCNLNNGGGGSSSSSGGGGYSGTVIINEVGSSTNTNSRWFEVYNNSGSDAQLSDYTLRCWGMNAATGAPTGSVITLSVPSLVLHAGSYAVVRGAISGYSQNTSQLVWVGSGQTVPYWSTSGFVELVKNNGTADFVSFGGDSTAPTTPGFWSGGDAPYLTNAAGASIGRDGASGDTQSASDWTFHAFATPGGPNDVTSDADSVGDGIPDCAKQPGSTYAGLPLNAWGATPGTTNIFVHIDYMGGSDPACTPRKEALDKVTAVFAAHGILIHFDVGNLFTSSVNPSLYNLDNKSHQVPLSQAIAIGDFSGYANLYAYKYSYDFELAKRQIFHYCLIAYSQNADGSPGSSGVSELPGNDYLVSLGNWGLAVSPASELNRLINYQAATIMHELGHNLGLRHGGPIDENYKPNYYSIMNHMYQLEGLPPTNSTPNYQQGDRYYFYRYFNVGNASFSSYFPDYPNYNADMTNSSISDPSVCAMDYSSGTFNSIDENLVSESGGLGENVAYVDYDGSHGQNDGYPLILNPYQYSSPGDKTSRETLLDHNDWAALDYFFARNTSGDSTGTVRSGGLRMPKDVIGDDRQKIVVETLTRPPFGRKW